MVSLLALAVPELAPQVKAGFELDPAASTSQVGDGYQKSEHAFVVVLKLTRMLCLFFLHVDHIVKYSLCKISPFSDFLFTAFWVKQISC